MLTLVIDDHIPFIKGVLEPYANIIYARGGLIDHEMALRADGLIIRTRTRCDAALLEGTPVKFIATATIGYDHIDTDYCNQKEISWYHAPGCNSTSVMQYIASALVSISNHMDISLEGKKIGIIGVGNVGSKVARLAELLGMVPLLNDPPRARNEQHANFVSQEIIRKEADFISFHVPLSKDGIDRTFHMADYDFFASLEKKPFLINTSRGEVIDSNEVKQAIKDGKISGYLADVWENEPVVDPELLRMTQIATPHIAGYSVEGKANGTAACVQAVGRFFGFPLETWYPSLLPHPENTVIEIDTTGKSDQEIISEAILAAYDIMDDDDRFRADPSQFENLRNYYPVRREFQAFQINLDNPGPELFQKLSILGFSTNF
jgi:erythronate-4-phosphate dehydrogenase